MLENCLKQNSLFVQLQEFASALDLCIVEARKDIRNATDIKVSVTLARKNGEVSIKDCEDFHRSVLPSLELEIGRDILSMEVSSAGVQRTIKDLNEFFVFEGRYCRVYSQKYSSWVEGYIGKTDDKCLQLLDYIVVDTKDSGCSILLDLNEISKAKLEYKWETKEDKKQKNNEIQKALRKANKDKKVNSGENK